MPDPDANQTSVTVGGLRNGTGYRFQIRAVNDRGEGVWSSPSAEEVPFTAPERVATPSLTALNDNDDQKGYVTVSWDSLDSPENGCGLDHGVFRSACCGTGTSWPSSGDGGTTQKSFDVENGHVVQRAGQGHATVPGPATTQTSPTGRSRGTGRKRSPPSLTRATVLATSATTAPPPTWAVSASGRQPTTADTR